MEITLYGEKGKHKMCKECAEKFVKEHASIATVSYAKREVNDGCSNSMGG